MKRRSLFCALIASLIASYASASGDFYSYKDKNGVLHLTNVYSDKRFSPVWKSEKKAEPLDEERIDRIIHSAARKHDVDAKLIKAVIRAESDFNPYAVSRAGAKGLMQLMPETSSDLNVSNPYNAHQSIEGGTRYLRSLLDYFKNDIKLALAAYNAGKTTVLRYNGIPPYEETRNYVRKVLAYYNQYSRL